MNSRAAQDVILRLLADGPFRRAAKEGAEEFDAKARAIVARVDFDGLDRFGRFLCRHYYRERVVHYFKYARALTPITGRAPEAALKSGEFNALLPGLILGERQSAERVLALVERHLMDPADSIRAVIPYWNDLVTYQGFFFLSDTLPADAVPRRFPSLAPTARLVDFAWDLPAVLPALLRPFQELPLPPQKPVRLLFARSAQGEVTVLRCPDSLQNLLEGLSGRDDPREVAQRIGLDAGTLEQTLRRLQDLGALVAQEAFSSSHVASAIPQAGGAE